MLLNIDDIVIIMTAVDNLKRVDEFHIHVYIYSHYKQHSDSYLKSCLRNRPGNYACIEQMDVVLCCRPACIKVRCNLAKTKTK